MPSMPRPQFSLKTLLWLMALVGAFLGGMAAQRQLEKPLSKKLWALGEGGRMQVTESMTMRDGTVWHRGSTSDLNEGRGDPQSGARE